MAHPRIRLLRREEFVAVQVEHLQGTATAAGDARQRVVRHLHVQAGFLERFPHSRGPLTDAAVLDSALASLEVRTTAVHDGGDHDIVVGEVLALAQAPGDARPLLYYDSGYRELR